MIKNIKYFTPGSVRLSDNNVTFYFNLSCTETYHTKSAQISIFGIPLWYPTNTPRIAISPAVQPGQCWAFQGFPGFLGKCFLFLTFYLIQARTQTCSAEAEYRYICDWFYD